MRVIFFLLILSGVLLAQNTTDVPWFGDVATPAAISTEDGKTLASLVREGLLKRKSPAKIVKNIPEDGVPRIVFLTLFDGKFPSRCYFASGFNMKDALERLLVLVERREKEYTSVIVNELAAQVEEAKEEKRQLPLIVKEKMSHPEQWNALQLDIVQSTMPIESFHIPSSKILLSSAVGIAFAQGAGFTFTPEQLTGRCLMNAERQLSTTNVSNLLTESANWNAWKLWNMMCAADSKFPVWLFESDSYYADEHGSVRLYRGYPVQHGVADSTPAQVQAGAKEILTRTMQLVNERGMVSTPFLEWYPELEDNQEGVRSMAVLAWLLADGCEDKELASAERKERVQRIQSIARMMLKSTKHYDSNEKRSIMPDMSKKRKTSSPEPRRKAKDRSFACLVEPERLEKEGINDLEVPRRVTMLETNAVGLLAYMRLYDILGESDSVGRACGQQLKPLMTHILAQFTQDCEFIMARVYPENKPVTALEVESDDVARIASLCGLAALQYARKFPNDSYSDTLLKFADALHNMLKKKFFVKDGTLTSTPPLEPMLVRFMGCYCTAADKEMHVTLQQMALNATQGVEHAPLLPDMYGSLSDIPSTTYAAQLHWLCSEVAIVIAKCGRQEDARAILQDSWPLWVFQQYAVMNATASSALPQPYRYIGFCRDNLADFGFTLDGQLTHILSRRTLASAMQAAGVERYQGSADQQKEVTSVWQKIDHHPICLSKELVIASETAGEYNDRTLMGKLSKPTVTKMQSKYTYRKSEPKQRVSSGVRKPPTPSKKK